MSHHLKNKGKLIARLNRIEGQVRAVGRMIEEDKSHMDILNLIAAARAALGKVGTIALHEHLEGCLVEAIQEGKGIQAIDEVIEIMDKYVK